MANLSYSMQYFRKTSSSSNDQVENRSHKCIPITKMEGGKMVIDIGAFQNILSRPNVAGKPVAFICTAGRTSLGKSFLLNFFIRYFREKGWENPNWIGDETTVASKNDIKWKSGTDPCTKGVQIFDEVFELPLQDGTRLPVLIVDTQGLFDHETSKDVNKTLLTLSALLSSVLILNASKIIDTQDLDYLKTCIDYAHRSAETDDGEYCLELQRLLFLLRDVPEERYDGPGGIYSFENGRRHMEKVFRSTTVGLELQEIYKGIQTSFEKCDCFLLPHPGNEAELLKFTGSNGDLRKVFLESVERLIGEIASPSSLEARRSAGKIYTAEEIVDVIASCNRAFATGDFDANQLIEANLKPFYCARYEDAMDHYVQQWKTHGVENIADLETLKGIENAFRNLALSLYDNAEIRGKGNVRSSYRSHLEEKCEEYFSNVVERWENEKRKKEITIQMNTHEAFNEYSRRLQSVGVVSPETYKERHRQLFREIRQKYQTIDEAQLKKKVDETFRKAEESNALRHREERDVRHTERQLELCNLVARLRLDIVEDWKKELDKRHRDEQDMTRLEKKIEKNTLSKFWKQALTRDEVRYADMLKQQIQNFMENAASDTSFQFYSRRLTREATKFLKEGVAAVVTDNASRMSKKVKSLYYSYWKHEENNEYLQSIVDKVMSEVRNQASSMSSGSSHEQDLFTEKFMTDFYNACCEDLVLQNAIMKTALDSEYKVACEENVLLWDIAKNIIENSTRNILLELETKILEQLTDSYYEESAIRILYKKTEQEINDALFQNQSLPQLSVLRSSNEAKKYAKKFAKSEIEKSLTKMLAKNAENEEKRRQSKWKKALDFTIDIIKAIGLVIAEIVTSLVKE